MRLDRYAVRPLGTVGDQRPFAESGAENKNFHFDFGGSAASFQLGTSDAALTQGANPKSSVLGRGSSINGCIQARRKNHGVASRSRAGGKASPPGQPAGSHLDPAERP